MALEPKENFGFEQASRWRSRVIGTLAVEGRDECLALLRAVEAGLRISPGDALLVAKRRQLMNMRYRAHREDWSGWA